MTDKILILTTTESDAQARKIAEALVEQRLAACVNILPRIQSVYRWKGAVETAEEHLLIIKTSNALAEQVRAAIKEMHSYELPEIIAIGIDSGSQEYLQWLSDSIS